jgi:anti-sigma regulatory factor (Ser/Thr protein kinase)
LQSPKVILVDDSSRIAEVRRAVLAMAEHEGLSETSASSCAIIATELATNLSKHAKEGEVHVMGMSGRGLSGVEILSVDRGPGVANLQQSLVDGYSTSGTAGTGLGAVKRLASEFDAYSLPGRGTVIAARVFSNGTIPSPVPALKLGIAAKPLAGEEFSGDAWAIRFGQTFQLLMVADGLGHGVLASEASAEAVRTFARSKEDSTVGLLQQIHGALRGTRGAAIAIAKIDFTERRVLFAGLGNIAGVVISANGSPSPKLQSMISHNGTAGHEARNMKEFVYSIAADDTIVMHSDGLSSNWNLQGIPGLLNKHPSVIAGTLYREYARHRDDVCVVVGRRP